MCRIMVLVAMGRVAPVDLVETMGTAGGDSSCRQYEYQEFSHAFLKDSFASSVRRALKYAGSFALFLTSAS